MARALTLTGAICTAALAAVWVGYPLAIGLVVALRRVARLGARAAKRDPTAPTALPRVTVVVATREAPDVVAVRVTDCVRAEYPPDLLDVVVGYDWPAVPPGIIGKVERATVVAADAPGGKAAALNAAARAARGDVLVFADAYQRFAPDAIARLVAAFGDPRIAAVSGRLEVPPSTRQPPLVAVYWRIERWLRRREAEVHSTVGVTGAVWAMRRSLWEPLPPGLLLDDLYTPMRLVLDGHRVGFANDAIAFETRAGAIAHEYRRKVRTLTGVLQLCAWLPSVLVPVRNPIWIQFTCHKLLRMLTPYLSLGVAVWVGWVIGRWAIAHPVLAAAALAVIIGAGAVARVNVFRLCRDAVVSGTLMQLAIIRATYNGLRGRWNVWGTDRA